MTAGMMTTIEGERMMRGPSSIRSALPVYSRMMALRAVQTWRGSNELFSTNTLSVSIEWFYRLKARESPYGGIILSIQRRPLSTQRKEGESVRVWQEDRNEEASALRRVLLQKIKEDPFTQTAVADRTLIVGQQVHHRGETRITGNDHIGPSGFQGRRRAPRGQRCGRQQMQQLPRSDPRQPMTIHPRRAVNGKPQIHRCQGGRGPGGADERRPVKIGQFSTKPPNPVCNNLLNGCQFTGDWRIAVQMRLGQLDDAQTGAHHRLNRFPRSQDELGASAADVHNQNPSRFQTESMPNAKQREPRLLVAVDYPDAEPAFPARRLYKLLPVARFPHGTGSDRRDALGIEAVRRLSKSSQNRQASPHWRFLEQPTRQ